MNIQNRAQREFLANVLSEQKFTLGRESTVEEPSLYGETPHISQLRVSWLDPSVVAEQWTADLWACGIGPIGPIDLPFTFNVEQQVIVVVRPLAAPAARGIVVATLCDLPACNCLYQATYWPPLDQSGIANIPPWVLAVTLFGDPLIVVGSYLDWSGNTLATFPAGPSPVARPREAVQIQVSGGERPSRVLFHY